VVAVLQLIINYKKQEHKSIILCDFIAMIWLIVCLIVPSVASRSVSVDLDALWPRYLLSPLAEIGEFMAEQSSDLYWHYVDTLCKRSFDVERIVNSTSDINEDASVELQALAVDVGREVAPPAVEYLLETSLTLGVYGPRLEFFRSLSSTYGDPCNGSSFIYVPAADTSVCTVTEAITLLGDASRSDITEDWDHIHSVEAGDGGKELGDVVLWGVPGDSSFCSLHSELSNRRGVQYHSRPGFPGQAMLSESSPLQAYGVILDIKNMEYKAIDDTRKTADDEDDEEGEHSTSGDVAVSASFPENEAVGGIVFSTLLRRHGESGGDVKSFSHDLMILREGLLEQSASGEGETEMKVWKMKDLGLQTVQLIMDSNDPASRMASLLQSFPVHASAVSSAKLRTSLLQDIERFNGLGGPNVLPPNSIFINGVRYDLDSPTLNVFDILHQISREYAYMTDLDTLPLSTSTKESVRSIAVKLGKDSGGPQNAAQSFRVDVSKGGKYAISFINNLEKDRMYKRWGSSLQSLLYPSWNLATVARNLYTLVVVVDPLSMEGVSMLQALSSMFEQMYPIRMGIVLDCSGQAMGGNSGKPITGYEICGLFHGVKSVAGSPTAVRFLLEVAAAIKMEWTDHINFSVGEAANMYTNFLENLSKSARVKAVSPKQLFEEVNLYTGKLKNEDKSIDEGSDSAKAFLLNSTSYINARGLPSNSFALNGIVVESPDIGQEVMRLLGREQFLLSRLVQQGRLKDNTKSIFGTLMSIGEKESQDTDSENEDEDEEEDPIAAMMGGGGQIKVGKVYTRFHPLLGETTSTYLQSTRIEVDTILGKDESFLRLPEDGSDSVSCPLTSVVVAIKSSPLGFSSAAAALRWLQSDSRGDLYRVKLSVTPPSSEEDELSFLLIDSVLQLVCSEDEVSGEECIKLAVDVLTQLSEGTSPLKVSKLLGKHQDAFLRYEHRKNIRMPALAKAAEDAR
jgi:hypothetical protein